MRDSRGVASGRSDRAFFSRAMGKYYCDYCDSYLTHDSQSGRRQHMRGRKHRDCVRRYYAHFLGPMMGPPPMGPMGPMGRPFLPPPPHMAPFGGRPPPNMMRGPPMMSGRPPMGFRGPPPMGRGGFGPPPGPPPSQGTYGRGPAGAAGSVAPPTQGTYGGGSAPARPMPSTSGGNGGDAKSNRP